MLKSTHYGAYSNGLEIALIFLSEVAVRSGIELLSASPSREQFAKLGIISVTAKENGRYFLIFPTCALNRSMTATSNCSWNNQEKRVLLYFRWEARLQLTKTQTTLLESFGTTCFVLPLSGIWSEVYFHHLPANIKTYSHEYQNFQEAKTKKNQPCAACFSALALFLLLLIPEHEMRRLVLMANDVNSFTVRHHQYQTINLEKIGISKRVIPVFVALLQFCWKRENP